MRTVTVVLFLVTLFPVILRGQETDYGPGYGSLMISNPGLSGIEPDSRLRMSYFNFYPGRNFRLHSIFVSYDSYVPVIHGGIGFYLTGDYHGSIMNDLRGGGSYAYQLKAGEDLYISAGLSASFFHRGFNFSKALLPDQIDPLGVTDLPSGEALQSEGRTVFDAGTGFVLFTRRFAAGLSFNHLAEPDISMSSSVEKLRRKLTFHFAGDFDLNESSGIKLRPLAFMTKQAGFITGGPGIVYESRVLSLNLIMLGSNSSAVDIQTGFALTTGKLRTFYNYRFNLSSGNNMLPFSLVLHTGLSYSLNNVDKRKNAGALNFPKL